MNVSDPLLPGCHMQMHINKSDVAAGSHVRMGTHSFVGAVDRALDSCSSRTLVTDDLCEFNVREQVACHRHCPVWQRSCAAQALQCSAHMPHAPAGAASICK